MAMVGRKPKPTALKVLEGDRGKGRRPLNEHEPVPPKGGVKCPSWLLPEAKKEWKRLAASLEAMGVLTMADLTAFAGYCQAYARWREAEDFITQHGSIFKTPSGYVQQVPQVSIAQQNLKIMQSFATEFGLTPACRARIVASGGAAESDDDPMARLLKGGWQDDVSTVAWGNERDFGEAIALLKACKESILNIYSRRSPIDRGTLAAMMTATTWMDAGAALAQGFIDGVADPQTYPADSTAVHTVNRKDAEAKVRLWLERHNPLKQGDAAQKSAAEDKNVSKLSVADYQKQTSQKVQTHENPGIPADQLRRRLDLIKPNDR